MRPTTKDLAKHAGVSLASVDRVLNGRSGVRKSTIEKVNVAIGEIGFVRDISAANLARRKGYRFMFLLPKSGGEFVEGIVERIAEANRAFAVDRVQVDVSFLTENDPHSISARIDAIGVDQVDGVAIMAPATPQVRDAIARLRARGVSVVTIVSKQPNDVDGQFIGIDNMAAGKTAARLMGKFVGARTGAVIVLCETMQALDGRERRAGFDAIVNTEFPSLRLLPSLETHGDPERVKGILRNAAGASADIAGVYVTSATAEHVIPYLRDAGMRADTVVIAHERTPFTERALRDRSLDVLITQNSGHLVRSAIRTMKARIDRREILTSQEKVRIEIVIQDNL